MSRQVGQFGLGLAGQLWSSPGSLTGVVVGWLSPGLGWPWLGDGKLHFSPCDSHPPTDQPGPAVMVTAKGKSKTSPDVERQGSEKPQGWVLHWMGVVSRSLSYTKYYCLSYLLYFRELMTRANPVFGITRKGRTGSQTKTKNISDSGHHGWTASLSRMSNFWGSQQ